MKRTLGCLAVTAFLVACIALASVLITPHYPQADSGEPAYTFDSEEELHDYVQDYMEDHYSSDQSAFNQESYEEGSRDGWREGYDEGYVDGYQAGYEDGANGAEYWEP